MSCEESFNDRTIWIKPDSITISCDEYFNVETDIGILTNNVWNKHAAKKDVWQQCLEKRVIDGEIQYGWSWSWPFGRRVIYSQPQIKIGASPWAPEPKFDQSFPIKISGLSELQIQHELEITTNGNHNIATTMWLVSEPYKGNKPNADIIAAEVMIWTYSTESHFDPAGKKFSEIEIGSDTWEVWYQKNWDDKSGINENKWISLSFRNKKSSMKAIIPALSLLKFATTEGLISEDLYIADVELGNEIMSGSGMTWIKQFGVVY